MKQIKVALDIVYKITFLLDIYTSAALPGPVHKWTARGSLPETAFLSSVPDFVECFLSDTR